MKFILFIVNIFVFGCSARPSTSVQDQLDRLQQSIAVLNQTYDEKIQTYDEKIQKYDEKIQMYDEKLKRYDDIIASLEQQLRFGRTFVPQSGTVSFSV